MEIANLHDNRLSGSIPSEIGQWERLWALYLNFNEATGVAPHEWGDALQLRFDNDWDSNQFSGTIPSTLGLCTNLHYLWIPNGNLRGTLPTELGLLHALSHASFANNTFLEGSVPLEVLALAGKPDSSMIHFNINGTAVTNGTLV